MSHRNPDNLCKTYSIAKELELPGTAAPHCQFVRNCDGSNCQKDFASSFMNSNEVLPDPRDAAQEAALANIIEVSLVKQLRD